MHHTAWQDEAVQRSGAQWHKIAAVLVKYSFNGAMSIPKLIELTG